MQFFTFCDKCQNNKWIKLKQWRFLHKFFQKIDYCLLSVSDWWFERNNFFRTCKFVSIRRRRRRSPQTTDFVMTKCGRLKIKDQWYEGFMVIDCRHGNFPDIDSWVIIQLITIPIPILLNAVFANLNQQFTVNQLIPMNLFDIEIEMA